jgi:hypothetical protein
VSYPSLNCRKRKLKCDAGKPACQQCARAGSESDCSYDNGKALSKTQILQQRIAQLEAKLSSLQGRGGSSSGASPVSSASSILGGAATDGTRKKDDSATPEPFGANGLVGIRTSSRSPSMGAFPSSLYNDSTFGTSLDFANTTVAPQLISSGAQPRMSPYLQSTVDLYDPNAPWPNSAGVSDQQQGTLYSSPSGSSYNLNDSTDPLSLSSSGTLSKSSSGLSASSLDLRGSLRAQADPIFITSTDQGRRYLYVFLHNYPQFFLEFEFAALNAY